VFGVILSIGIFIFLHRPWWLLIWVPLMPLQWLRVQATDVVLRSASPVRRSVVILPP